MFIKRLISYLDINNKITYGQYFAYVILMLLILLAELICLYYIAFYYLSADIPIIKNDNFLHKIKPKVVGGIKILNSDKTIYDKIKNENSSTNNQVKISPLPEQPLKISDNENYILKNEEVIYADLTTAEPTANAFSTRNVNKVDSNNKPLLQDLEIIILDKFDNRLKNLLLHLPTKKHSIRKYRLYLDSSYNADLAKEMWQQIFENNKKVLKNYDYIIDKVIIDSSKVIYNILAGEFSSFSNALTLCKKLISNQQNCVVVQC
ncbi:sporulation related domain protein [Orientia chuto str. Dubai]|uniref:Sporulation related domain protein n=1 Tax=Orientia chuto str. Dubai TaxID=1359168 RepID=A0A0F3MLW4_9RICK|nr:SPOR domain-containing protein [Candidatus Orientia mediorientalis]KJV56641.1 sporulation related domain protein [Orientia chuto str. Dubai]